MKLFLTILFSIGLINLLSQSKNFVVTNSGDTIAGTYTVSGNNITIAMPAGVKKTFSSSEIKTVSSANGTLTVFHSILSTYSDDIEIVDRSSYRDMSYDTTMLLKEVYTTPKMNLYWGTDINKTQYYFVKRPIDSLPQQLVVRYHMWRPDKNVPGALAYSVINQQKIYANQLRMLMEDCEKISPVDWDILDYRVYSFKKLIKKYNKCK